MPDSNIVHSADFTYLKQRLKNVRVILLGEPNHGIGTVTERKADLIRFLADSLGFNMLSFESGFYDMHKAQEQINRNEGVKKALRNSVFPVWSQTKEFSPIFNLVKEKKISISGFDPQVSGAYGENDYISDMQLAAQQFGLKTASIDFDLMDEAVTYMGEHYRFPETIDYRKFMASLNQLKNEFKQIKSSRPAGEHEAIGFWLQCIDNLSGLAKDYFENDPSAKTEKNFQAKDSNFRDSMMAENLLYIVRQYPESKIICWGASAHFANRVEVLHNAELSLYNPMGKRIISSLGEEVYSIAFLPGRGMHRDFTGDIKPVARPATTSIEAELLQNKSKDTLIDLSLSYKKEVISDVFDLTPLNGYWGKIFNALYFIDSVGPSTYVGRDAEMEIYTDTSGRIDRTEDGADYRPGFYVSNKRSGYYFVRDKVTLKPIPSASFHLLKAGVSGMANDEGVFNIRYEKALPGDSILLSCVGYKSISFLLKYDAGDSERVFYLQPLPMELPDVVVTGKRQLKPAEILLRAIAAIKTNFTVPSFTSDVYARDYVCNYDTIIYDVEYVKKRYADSLSENNQGREILKHLKRSKNYDSASREKYGNILGIAVNNMLKSSEDFDVLFTQKIFDADKIRRFKVQLERTINTDSNKIYVVAFKSKSKSHKMTGGYYVNNFSGVIYINAGDYAIVRYEFKWDKDPTTLNETARRKYPKNNKDGWGSRYMWNLIRNKFSDSLIVTYKRILPGKYVFEFGKHTSIDEGYNQINNTEVCIRGTSYCLQGKITFDPGVKVSLSDTINFKTPGEIQFWKNFIRPYSEP